MAMRAPYFSSSAVVIVFLSLCLCVNTLVLPRHRSHLVVSCKGDRRISFPRLVRALQLSTKATTEREDYADATDNGGLTQLTTVSDSDEAGTSEKEMTSSDVVEKFFSASTTMNAQHEENLPKFLKLRRETGNQLLSSLNRPYRKDEAWRHTNLKALFAPAGKMMGETKVEGEQRQQQQPSLSDIKDHIDERCAKSHLTFIDGVYCAELSCTTDVPKEVTFTSLSASAVTDVQLESSLMLVPDKEEKPRDSFGSDVLSALNMANAKEICVVKVPEYVETRVPLQIINYITKAATTSFPVMAVILGDNSTLQLKQSYISHKDATAYVGGFTSIRVARGAKMRHTFTQEMSPHAVRHMEVISSDIMSEGVYDVSVLQTGAKIGRVNAHINLLEENANCTLHGVSIAHTRQSIDVHTSIIHDTPSANSNQQQRNIIGDMGLAIFKGRIRIPKHAQLTKSGQLCRSLMLGGRARLIAMPTLEITADNVECSHGASVADLDENEMFYLAARGVSRKEARKLLLRSFALELLSEDIMDDAAIGRVIDKIESMSPDYDDVNSATSKKQHYFSI